MNDTLNNGAGKTEDFVEKGILVRRLSGEQGRGIRDLRSFDVTQDRFAIYDFVLVGIGGLIPIA